MRKQQDEIELQRFYRQWAPHVMLFCRLYTGNSETAEKAVAQTFLKYFRSELRLHLDRVPTALMSLAVEESNCAGDGCGADVDSEFEWAVLGLPPEERAVFILHGMLDLQLPWVAAVGRLSFAAASQLWVRALLQLRMSTVKDDCSRLFEPCDFVPNSAAEICA